MIVFFATLFSEKEIKNKAQDYAYENGGGEWKIDCEVVLFVIEVSGKAADVRNLLAEGEDNSDDGDCHAYYNEKFADGLKGFHEWILTRERDRGQGEGIFIQEYIH